MFDYQPSWSAFLVLADSHRYHGSCNSSSCVWSIQRPYLWTGRWVLAVLMVTHLVVWNKGCEAKVDAATGNDISFTMTNRKQLILSCTVVRWPWVQCVTLAIFQNTCRYYIPSGFVGIVEGTTAHPKKSQVTPCDWEEEQNWTFFKEISLRTKNDDFGTCSWPLTCTSLAHHPRRSLIYDHLQGKPSQPSILPDICSFQGGVNVRCEHVVFKIIEIVLPIYHDFSAYPHASHFRKTNV